MEWMGKQNYHSTNTSCYQQQRFCRRAITRSVRNPLFGPNWFISLRRLTDSNSRYSYSWQLFFLTISILIMMSAISKHCLALIFLFIAKCLSKWAVVCLETEELWAGTVFVDFLSLFKMNSFWAWIISNYRCVCLGRRFSVGHKQSQ